MNDSPSVLLLRVAARCGAILLHPIRVWDTIKSEPGGLRDAFYPFAMVLGLIPLVMTLVLGAGTHVLLARMGVSSGPSGWFFGLGYAVVAYAAGLLVTLALGFVMSWLAPLFGARTSPVLTCRILIYASTPLLIAGVLAIVPVFGLLFSFMALPWALVLLYIGIGKVFDIRGARQLLFTLTTVLILPLAGFVPMAFFHKPVHFTAAPPLATADPQMANMLAEARVQSGQGSDADMETMATAQIQGMVAGGQVRPDQAAAVKKDILQGLHEAKAQMAKSALPAGDPQ